MDELQVGVGGGQRLGLVDEVAAGLQPDLAAEAPVNVGLDAEGVEDGVLAAVELDALLEVRHEARHEALHVVEDAALVDDHAVHLVGEGVADDAEDEAVVGVDARRRLGVAHALLDLVPVPVR